MVGHQLTSKLTFKQWLTTALVEMMHNNNPTINPCVNQLLAEKLCIATTVSMIQLVKLQLIQKFLFLTPLSAKTFTT